jgi:hypothetical protein
LKEFERDFFSNTSTVHNELPETEALLIHDYIENFYPSIGKVKASFSFGSLDINSRNIKVVSEVGTFTLKFWESTPRKKVDEIIQLLIFLHSQEMRIPIPIKNRLGGYLSGPQNKLASLFCYVDGELYSPTQDNLGQFFQATGQLFSNLGKITKSVNLSTTYITSPIETQVSITQSLRNNRLWEDLDSIELQECLKSMWPLINKDLDSFRHLNNLSKLQYSHYDLHPKNILFDSDKGFGFLDFASCAISNPNIAWGFLLIKNLRQAVVNGNEYGDAKLLASKAVSDLQKIDFAQNLDILNLPIYGRYEIAKRLAYILDEYTKFGMKTWLSMLPVQIRLLKESYLLFGEN